jgi:hypothetical protein
MFKTPRTFFTICFSTVHTWGSLSLRSPLNVWIVAVPNSSLIPSKVQWKPCHPDVTSELTKMCPKEDLYELSQPSLLETACREPCGVFFSEVLWKVGNFAYSKIVTRYHLDLSFWSPCCHSRLMVHFFSTLWRDSLRRQVRPVSGTFHPRFCGIVSNFSQIYFFHFKTQEIWLVFRF